MTFSVVAQENRHFKEGQNLVLRAKHRKPDTFASAWQEGNTAEGQHRNKVEGVGDTVGNKEGDTVGDKVVDKVEDSGETS